MAIATTNPATGEVLKRFDAMSSDEVDQRLGRAVAGFAALGRTSFALDFQTRPNGGQVTCSARTVYVVVATDGSGKRELPSRLIDALGPAAPLRADPA